MSRFDELIATVETYQGLAAENYDRIRRLAEELYSGLCAFMESSDGQCVQLVPPVGPFEPKPYGDKAFSLPPRGFRPLGPVAFGLAIRVTRGTDWLRLTLECRKIGERFIVRVQDGEDYEFKLPLAETDPEPFYQHIYDHVLDWFQSRIDRYKDGDWGTREIGFDFATPVESDA